MGEAVLVNRKKLITSLANELVEPFDKLSKKTRVPKSRLIDEAVEAVSYTHLTLPTILRV